MFEMELRRREERLATEHAQAMALLRKKEGELREYHGQLSRSYERSMRMLGDRVRQLETLAIAIQSYHEHSVAPSSSPDPHPEESQDPAAEGLSRAAHQLSAQILRLKALEANLAEKEALLPGYALPPDQVDSAALLRADREALEIEKRGFAAVREETVPRSASNSHVAAILLLETRQRALDGAEERLRRQEEDVSARERAAAGQEEALAGLSKYLAKREAQLEKQRVKLHSTAAKMQTEIRDIARKGAGSSGGDSSASLQALHSQLEVTAVQEKEYRQKLDDAQQQVERLEAEVQRLSSCISEKRRAQT